MSYTHEFLNYPTKTFNICKEFPTNDLLGIEIEYEGMRYIAARFQTHAKMWLCGDDGSLRNFGREFQLKEPLFGEDLQNAIKEFNLFIKEQEQVYKKIEISERCSIHIHCNILDMKVEEFKSLIYWFVIFEPLFFELYGKQRKHNHNCVSFSEKQYNNAYLKMFTEERFMRTFDFLGRDKKYYCSLNIGAVKKFGSIEIRLFPATKDMDLLKEYCQLCLALKYFSKKNAEKLDLIIYNWTDMGPEEIIKSMNYGDFSFEKKINDWNKTRKLLKRGLYNLIDYINYVPLFNETSKITMWDKAETVFKNAMHDRFNLAEEGEDL